MTKHNVLLVPGFFGFGSLGELLYFEGVKALLERTFASAGLEVQVTEVETLPTSSIRVRAARVHEALARLARESTGPIHIIGHSTGGLDARLAIAPTASLPSNVAFTAYDRVHTLVTVCCSHFGSPVATFFSGAVGRRLLRIACRFLIWALGRRRLLLAALLRVGHWMLGLWRPFRNRSNTFDEIYAKVLNELSEERRAELVRFFRGVSSDEALVFQLTPAGCDLLNACTAEPKLRYGSVVARAPSASWRGYSACFGDPYAQLIYPLYALVHRIAARHEARWIPDAVGAQRERLIEFWGELPSASDNDGIVPTNSQIWGEIVHATHADHLDVIGHFGPGDSAAQAGDWLPSNSGFDTGSFERLWGDVAGFILAGTRRGSEPDAAGAERTEEDLPAESGAGLTRPPSRIWR